MLIMRDILNQVAIDLDAVQGLLRQLPQIQCAVTEIVRDNRMPCLMQRLQINFRTLVQLRQGILRDLDVYLRRSNAVFAGDSAKLGCDNSLRDLSA